MDQQSIQRLDYLLHSSDKTIRQEIGKRIRKERLKRALRASEAAESLGISQSFYGLVERGERMLLLPKLIKFCVLFDVDMNYLVGLEEECTVETNPDKNMAVRYLLSFDDDYYAVINTMLRDLYLFVNRKEDVHKFSRDIGEQE